MEELILKVLYVDDDTDLLEIGKIFLETNHNFHIDTATSAQEALNILKTTSYDAIVSDYQMEGMDGIELLQKIRMEIGDISFILFTGKGREEVVIDAINNGADFYLQKGGEPVSLFAELSHKIKLAVRKRRNEQEITFKNVILSTQQEVSPDAILIVDNNGMILDYNSKFVTLWGIPKHLLISRNDDIVLQYVSDIPADKVAFLNRVNYLYSHPEEKSFEEVILKDGRIIERYSSPMIGKNGSNYGRIWFFRDITIRKQSEKKLKEAYERISANKEELREKYDELLKSEEQTRENEEKFKTLFDLAPYGCSLTDMKGNFILINKYLERFLGLSSSEMKGKSSREFGKVPPEVVDKISKELQKKGKIHDLEVKIKNKEGETRTFSNSITYVELQGVQHVLTTMVDITDRIQAEHDLRNKTNQLSGIAESIPGVIFQLGVNGSKEIEVLYVSRKSEELFGIECNQETFFNNFISCLPPDDTEPFINSILDSSQEEKLWKYDGIFKKWDGRILYFAGIATCSWENQTKIITGVLLDISAQKQAEFDRIESEKKYHDLFENAILGIFRTSPDGEFIEVNPALASMFGVDSPDEIKDSIKDSISYLIINPEEREVMREKIVRSGEVRGFEAKNRNWKGQTLWLAINIKENRNDSEEIISYEGTVEDITIRKNAEIELSRKQEELQAAFEELASSEEELKEQFNELVLAHNEIENNEKKFRQLFMSNMAAIALHKVIINEAGDPVDLLYLDVNPAFEEITGLSKNDVLGRTFRELRFDINPEVIQRCGFVGLNGGNDHFENYEEALGYYYEISAYSPEKGEVAILFIDITKRKLTELKIRQTTEYLEQLIDGAPGPIVVWNQDYKITRINRACEDLLGIHSDSYIGLHLDTLVPGELFDKMREAFSQAEDTPHSHLFEFTMHHQDGNERIVIWNISQVNNPSDNNSSSTIAQGWDVTAERHLEREKQAAIQKINENVAKLSILNDGIRNPLNIILCLIDTIEDESIKKKIEEEINRIDDMVHNLDKEWESSNKILRYLRKYDYISL